MRRLLCIGDLNADITITADDRIAIGSDTPGRVVLAGGGSAANVAAGAVATSDDVNARFVGVVGDDLIGSILVDELSARGVEVRPVVRPATASRSIAALVDSAGDRSMVSDLSTATVLRLADVEPGWFDGVDWLHLTAYSWFPSGGPDVFGALVAAATERSIPWSVDPSSAQMLGSTRPVSHALIAFDGASVMFPSQDEAAALTAAEDPIQAAAQLLDLAETVVVTCGAEGAVVARRGRTVFRAAAHDVDVINTLGAGDAFAAGFIAARLAGRDDETSTEAGLVAGARAVTRPTAR
jgi:sugar/nucleoside kinase (ribokinase family)